MQWTIATASRSFFVGTSMNLISAAFCGGYEKKKGSYDFRCRLKATALAPEEKAHIEIPRDYVICPDIAPNDFWGVNLQSG